MHPHRTIASAPTLSRRLYRIGEAADLVDLSTGHVREMIRDGKLAAVEIPSPAYLPSRAIVRIPAAWLPHWLEGPRSIDAPTGQPAYVSVTSAAGALAVSHQTLRKLEARGLFPAFTRNGRARVSVETMDAWLDQHVGSVCAQWGEEVSE